MKRRRPKKKHELQTSVFAFRRAYRKNGPPHMYASHTIDRSIDVFVCFVCFQIRLLRSLCGYVCAMPYVFLRCVLFFFALLEYFLQLSQHIFKRLHSVRAAKTVTSIRLSVLMCCFSLNSTEFPKRIA